jgi:hypothetical protein
MSLAALREEIAHELSSRLLRLRPGARFEDSHPHRLRDARENLAPGVEYELLRGDLLGGAGTPVHGRTVFDELCDVDSSVALAANTFGPFRTVPERMSVPGLSGFDVLRLGKRLRTGLGGQPARLGMLALGADAILGASCVLTEPLSVKTANLAASCCQAVADAASPEWSALYESLCANPARFRSLDAAALVRQYLGLRSALADELQPKTLLYVFWEPLDWPDIPATVAHRREILEFSLAVAGSDIAFVSMSCSELWDAMEEGPEWAGRSEWLAYLRARYLFKGAST